MECTLLQYFDIAPPGHPLMRIQDMSLTTKMTVLSECRRLHRLDYLCVLLHGLVKYMGVDEHSSARLPSLEYDHDRVLKSVPLLRTPSISRER